jgi:alpha-D-xyloside xylohydrolase
MQQSACTGGGRDGHTSGETAIWAYGSRAYAALKKMLLLREKLRPYISAQMRIAADTGSPIVRPVWYHYPDSAAFTPEVQNTQFLFGPMYMVAPVVELGQRSRHVFFPQGGNCTSWRHWETGKVYLGGSSSEVAVPYDTPAAFKCVT